MPANRRAGEGATRTAGGGVLPLRHRTALNKKAARRGSYPQHAAIVSNAYASCKAWAASSDSSAAAVATACAWASRRA
jgi:hypothetical protein